MTIWLTLVAPVAALLGIPAEQITAEQLFDYDAGEAIEGAACTWWPVRWKGAA